MTFFRGVSRRLTRYQLPSNGYIFFSVHFIWNTCSDSKQLAYWLVPNWLQSDCRLTRNGLVGYQPPGFGQGITRVWLTHKKIPPGTASNAVDGFGGHLLFPGTGLISPAWHPMPTNSANTQKATRKLWVANPKATAIRIAPLMYAEFSFCLAPMAAPTLPWSGRCATSRSVGTPACWSNAQAASGKPARTLAPSSGAGCEPGSARNSTAWP